MKPHAALLAVAFLLGGLAGGFIGARCQKAAFQKFRERGFDSRKIFRKFNRELKLDSKQQEAVKVIIEKNRGKAAALHQEASDKFHQIRLSMRSEIGKVLTPEQQKTFAEMIARWEARRKNR